MGAPGVLSLNTLSAEALAALAQVYDLGDITGHWPATRGIENRNYFLAAVRDGIACEYVFTIMERPAYSGAALIPLLEACASRGLPVPAPIRTRGGMAQTDLDGKPAMLCARLPGRHVLNPTEAQVASLGRFIGRLHRSVAMAPLPPLYPRNRAWLERQALACRLRLPYLCQRLMQDALREVGCLLGRDDVGALPTGLIHADLFRDNVLFNRWGLSGVLDFHHAAHGFLIYDLAVAANDWCVDGAGAVDASRLEALIKAYAGIRPLEPAELWHLPTFMLYAGLAFWMSRLAGSLEPQRGRTDRGDNPEEFARMVAARRETPVHVDPWAVDQNVAAMER